MNSPVKVCETALLLIRSKREIIQTQARTLLSVILHIVRRNSAQGRRRTEPDPQLK